MIVVQIRNFTLFQDIVVFNANNEILMRTKATVKDMPEVISQLAETHHEYDIKIFGNKKFNANLKDKIKNCYFAKYSIDRLKIELV